MQLHLLSERRLQGSVLTQPSGDSRGEHFGHLFCITYVGASTYRLLWPGKGACFLGGVMPFPIPPPIKPWFLYSTLTHIPGAVKPAVQILIQIFDFSFTGESYPLPKRSPNWSYRLSDNDGWCIFSQYSPTTKIAISLQPLLIGTGHPYIRTVQIMSFLGYFHSNCQLLNFLSECSFAYNHFPDTTTCMRQGNDCNLCWNLVKRLKASTLK